MTLLWIIIFSFLNGMVFFIIGGRVKMALNNEDECPIVIPSQNQEPEQRKDDSMKTLTT